MIAKGERERLQKFYTEAVSLFRQSSTLVSRVVNTIVAIPIVNEEFETFCLDNEFDSIAEESKTHCKSISDEMDLSEYEDV